MFNKDELEYQSRIIQAASEGKDILYQVIGCGNGKWFPKYEGLFDFQCIKYKVKPKPLEVWGNVYRDDRFGRIYPSRIDAELGRQPDGETYKFVQVLEES